MIRYNINNNEMPKEVFNKNTNKNQSQLYTVSKLTFNNLEKKKNKIYEKDNKNAILVSKIKFNKRESVSGEEKNVKYIKKNKEVTTSNQINRTDNFINTPENVKTKNVSRDKSYNIEKKVNEHTQLCSENDNNNNNNNIIPTSNMNNLLNFIDLKNSSYLIKNNIFDLKEGKIPICELGKKIYKKSELLSNLKKIDNSSKISGKQNKKIVCELKMKTNEDNYMKEENKYIRNESSFDSCNNYITYQGNNNNNNIDTNNICIRQGKFTNNINYDEKKKKNDEYYFIKKSDISSNILNEKNIRVKLKDKVTTKNNSNYLYMNDNNNKNYSYKNMSNRKNCNNKINTSSFEHKKLNETKVFFPDKNNLEKKKKKKLELNKNVNIKSKYMTKVPKQINYEVNKMGKKNLIRNYSKKKSAVNKKLHVKNSENINKKKGNIQINLTNILQTYKNSLERREKGKDIKVNNIVKDCIYKKKDIFNNFINKKIKDNNVEDYTYVKYNFNNDELSKKDKIKCKDTHIYAYSVKQNDDENNSFLNFDKNEKKSFVDNECGMNLSKICFNFKDKIMNEKSYTPNIVEQKEKIENNNIFHYNNSIENVNKIDKNINNISYSNNNYIKQGHDINFVNYDNNTEFINENVNSSNILRKKRSKSVNYVKENKIFNSLIVTNEFRIKLCYSNNYVDFKKLNYNNIYEENKDANAFFPIKHDSFLSSSDLFLISIDSDKTKSNNVQQKKNSHINLNDFNNITDNFKQEIFHNSYFADINTSYSNSLNINENKEKFNLLHGSIINECNFNENTEKESSIYKDGTVVDKKNNEENTIILSIANKTKAEENYDNEKLHIGNCFDLVENNFKNKKEKKKYYEGKELCVSDRVLNNSRIINLNIFREIIDERYLGDTTPEKTKFNDKSLLLKKKECKNNCTDIIENDNLSVNYILHANECSTSEILEYNKKSLENTKRNILSNNKKKKKKKKLKCKDGKKKEKRISNKMKEKTKCDKKEFVKNTNNDSILEKKNDFLLLNTEKIKNMSTFNLKKEMNSTLKAKGSDNVVSKSFNLSKKDNNKKKKKINTDKSKSCKVKGRNNLTNDYKKNNNVLSLNLTNLTNRKKEKRKLVKKIKINKDNNYINNEKVKDDIIIKLTDKSSDIIDINLKGKKKKKKKNLITEKMEIKELHNYLNLTKNRESNKKINFIVNKNNKEMILNDYLKEVNGKNKNMILSSMGNYKNIKKNKTQKINKNKLKENYLTLKDKGLLMKYQNSSLIEKENKITKNMAKKNIYEVHNNIKFKGKNQIHQFSILKLLISKKNKKDIIKIEKKKKIISSFKTGLCNTKKWSKHKGKNSIFYKRKLEKKSFGDHFNHKNNLKKYNSKFTFNNNIIKLSKFNLKDNCEIVSVKSEISNSKEKKYSQNNFKNNEKATNEKIFFDMNCLQNIMDRINFKDNSDDSCFCKNLKSKEEKQINILNICYNNNLSINYIERNKEKINYKKSLENINENSNINYKKKKLKNKININKVIKKVNRKKKKKSPQKKPISVYVYNEKKKQLLFNSPKIFNSSLIENTFSNNSLKKKYQYLSLGNKRSEFSYYLDENLRKKKNVVEKEQGHKKKIEVKNVEYEKKLNKEKDLENILNKNNSEEIDKKSNSFSKKNILYNENIENNFTLENNTFLNFQMKDNLSTKIHSNKISLKHIEQTYGNSLHKNTVYEKSPPKKLHSYINENKENALKKKDSKENNIEETKNKNRGMITYLMKSNNKFFENTVKSNLCIGEYNEDLEKLFFSNYEDNFRYKSENLNSVIKQNNLNKIKICKNNCTHKKEKCHNLISSNNVNNNINEKYDIYNNSDANNNYSNKKNNSNKINSNYNNTNSTTIANNSSNIFINNEHIDKDIKENKLKIYSKDLKYDLKNETNKSLKKSPSIALNFERFVINHRINEISFKKNINNDLTEKKEKNIYKNEIKSFPYDKKEKTQEERIRKGVKTNLKNMFPVEKEKYLCYSNNVNIRKINRDYINFKKSNLTNNKNFEIKKYSFGVKKVKDIYNDKIFCSNFFFSNTPKHNTLNINETSMIKTLTIKDFLSNTIKEIKKKKSIFRTVSMNNIYRNIFPKNNFFNLNKKDNNLNKIENKKNSKRSTSTLIINNYKSIPYKLNKAKSLIYMQSNIKNINENGDNKNINDKFTKKRNYINTNILKFPDDKNFMYSFNLNNKNIYKKQLKEKITFKKNEFCTNEKIQRNKSVNVGSNFNILKKNVENNYNKTDNLYNHHKTHLFKKIKSLTFFKTNEKIHSNLNKNINEIILQKSCLIKNKNRNEHKKIKKCFSLLNENLNRKCSITSINLIKSEKVNKKNFLSSSCFLFESTLKNNKNNSEYKNKSNESKNINRYRSYTNNVCSSKSINNKKYINIDYIFKKNRSYFSKGQTPLSHL
ncbi:conserved Plasmodium protein, unknown function [Plasmodium relictum]|uniref:Uncharacterized protein n=1 Tax=Plasmodium relictum TaxID=85471 RepID=A0A1J1H1D2_PLARL|nr:conserved Plasmodium protein, unknown function [Plasmodium relictum]CRG98484.1 conserved Plasmodium protein, unknown function [Plasmodium relictum]